MTCDNQNLSSSPVICRAIDRAVSILVDVDNNIPEEVDLENIVVSVNAEWLASVCSALVDFAASDGVDTEELFEFKLLETASQQLPVSATIH